MQKRHFEAFAATIRRDVEFAKALEDSPEKDEALAETLNRALYAATVFANVAASDNARFDRARFLKACGL